MSLNGNYSLTITALGVTVLGNADRSATSGIEPIDQSLPVGHAGTLTTRSGDDSGVVTLTAGHDITTGKIDIHWPGGCRYSMDGTISDTNTLTLVGGDTDGGDVLPAESSAVVATPAETLDLTFDGDNLVLIGVGSTRQTSVRFLDSGDAVLAAILLVAGASWGWAEDMAIANPLTGNAVASVEVSNGDATYTSTLKITGLQY